jgi:acyl-CoA thioesterase-1
VRNAALALLLLPLYMLAQTTPPDTAQANQLIKRISQLMESTAASIPDLQVSTATLVAGGKNTAASLEKQAGNGPLTAEFIRRARAFLAISDSIPKPATLPETARNQFAELRGDFEKLETCFDALLVEKERQVRNPDPNNSGRYADENSRLPAPGANSRVVFMGDSITDFWHLNEYFTGRDFVNRGISGQVTSQMLGRMKADVLDLHPKAVMILGGTNDIARGTPLAVIENNLAMMTMLARSNNIKVLIASVLPVSAERSERPINAIQQLNVWIQNFCAQQSCTYVDYFSRMREGSGHLQTELADDGLHPNSRGYRIMAPIALGAIDKTLGISTEPSTATRRRKVRVF